ncbi:MAG: 50S ribosomal protein L9 [Holosporales bacterium]|jgi:large subunit ribosomal protein L9|nr:50S ribosomal protein L9 [Holosporales bacterium]
MKVVLLEKVEKLGSIGDEVEVKSGFARNFLLPRGKALRATPANLEYFSTRRTEIETQNLSQKANAEKTKEKMKDVSLVLVRQASESGMLFGSVRAADVCVELKGLGFAVNKNQVQLVAPIKSVGNHSVRVLLHAEVPVDIPIRVMTAQELQDKAAADEDEEGSEESTSDNSDDKD